MAGGVPLWQTTPEDLRLLWETDALGVWNTAHATVPHLLRSERSPAFVAVASAAGERGLWHLAAYCMAKHAVVGIVRGLAADLKGTGVTACAVAPGSTDTDMLRATADIYRVKVEELAQSQATGPAARPGRGGRGRRVRGDGRPGRARVRGERGRGVPVRTPALPAGFTVRLGRDTRAADGGRTLLGGSGAVLHLLPRARADARRRDAGDPRRRLRLGGPAAARPRSRRPGLAVRAVRRRRRRRRDGRGARAGPAPSARPAARRAPVDAARRRGRRRLRGPRRHPRGRRPSSARGCCGTTPAAARRPPATPGSPPC